MAFTIVATAATEVFVTWRVVFRRETDIVANHVHVGHDDISTRSVFLEIMVVAIQCNGNRVVAVQIVYEIIGHTRGVKRVSRTVGFIGGIPREETSTVLYFVDLTFDRGQVLVGTEYKLSIEKTGTTCQHLLPHVIHKIEFYFVQMVENCIERYFIFKRWHRMNEIEPESRESRTYALKQMD